MFKANKILRQNNSGLRSTIFDLETLIDFKNDEIQRNVEEIKRLQDKIEVVNYREKIWEDDRAKLNNIITNLIEERNKLTAENIEKSKKLETANYEIDTASNI